MEQMERCGLRLIPRLEDEGSGERMGEKSTEGKAEQDTAGGTEEAGGEADAKEQEGGEEHNDEAEKKEAKGQDAAENGKEKTEVAADSDGDDEDGAGGEETKEDGEEDQKQEQDKTPSSTAKELEPILSMGLNARLIDKHEVLLALVHRDQEDLDLWHVVGVGEQVKGEWREKEESQNFLNALPLSQRYIELLGIRKVDHAEKKVMHPFKMVPGDCLEVPALAVEHPVVIGMGWDVDPDVAMDLDCGLAVYSQGQVRCW